MDPPPPAAHDLAAGDTVRLGDVALEVRHVPGHCPGSVAFYGRAGGLLVGGDVLFQGSIGRTDLWEGDLDTLLASIRDERPHAARRDGRALRPRPAHDRRRGAPDEPVPPGPP